MYRIHFDPKIGRFVIQVAIWLGLRWKTVMVAQETESKVTFTFEKHSFAKYNDAMAHVAEIGLDKLYQNKSVNCYREHMNHAQPVQLPLHESYAR